jgi:hypothetical protein
VTEVGLGPSTPENIFSVPADNFQPKEPEKLDHTRTIVFESDKVIDHTTGGKPASDLIKPSIRLGRLTSILLRVAWKVGLDMAKPETD